ncbi:MAG: arylsulfatase [Ruthenibacterium sp.]
MTNKPNLVYILTDDLGYGDISALNPDSKIKTSAIDSLAADGLCFHDAHAASAVCTPSRYSILTGRYAWRTTLKEFVLMGYSEPLIEFGRQTTASMLQEAGYRTACVGKWHLGMQFAKNGAAEDDIDYTKPIAHGPVTNGFERFYGISASLDMPPYVYIENDRVTQPPNHTTRGTLPGYWREGPTAENFKHEDVLPTLTQRALDTIEEWKDEPFFLYFPLPAPHTPILPTTAFAGKTNTNAYGDFVLMCDDVVHKVLQKLDDCGIADNTIVIFTSDNGCSPAANYPELLAAGHNPSYIYRGTKADIYEGGHRIPLMVRWPAKIAAGLQSEQTVCLGDLMATMADVLEISLPDSAAEDSVSNLPIWYGEDKPVRDTIVHHSIDGSFSIRKGQWKLELCPGSGGWSDPVPGKEAPDAPAFQLYDMQTDVRERVNVIAQHPALAQELRALLASYVLRGRSTPGKPMKNTGDDYWQQLHWMRDIFEQSIQNDR